MLCCLECCCSRCLAAVQRLRQRGAVPCVRCTAQLASRDGRLAELERSVVSKERTIRTLEEELVSGCAVRTSSA